MITVIGPDDNIAAVFHREYVARRVGKLLHVGFRSVHIDGRLHDVTLIGVERAFVGAERKQQFVHLFVEFGIRL